MLDSGVNVFPCIFVGNTALTDSDLTALHALSFNEAIATYACHASFTFSKALYTNFDPCKISIQVVQYKKLCNNLLQWKDLDKHNNGE